MSIAITTIKWRHHAVIPSANFTDDNFLWGSIL